MLRWLRHVLGGPSPTSPGAESLPAGTSFDDRVAAIVDAKMAAFRLDLETLIEQASDILDTASRRARRAAARESRERAVDGQGDERPPAPTSRAEQLALVRKRFAG